jgi:hypothetical protein
MGWHVQILIESVTYSVTDTMGKPRERLACDLLRANSCMLELPAEPHILHGR